MGKDETIFRVVKNRENPYAQTDKLLLRDYRLDFGTRGLLAMLLSMPDDWEVRFSYLVKASPAGRIKLRTLIKDAVRHGYMHRERVNAGRHGKFKWVTLVYESPDLNPHFDPLADATVGFQPSVGYRPMEPSVENRPMEPSVENQPMEPSVENQPMEPSVENRPMAPSVGLPSMENRPIYIYIYMILKTEDDETENEKEEHGKHDDDVSPSPFPFSFKVNDQEFARAKRDAAKMLAGWCSAMILDWLPGWNGGERFADTLTDNQVHTLATWLWSFMELNGGNSYDARDLNSYYFKQRNGDPFEGITNPVGKIVAQIRLDNPTYLTDEDLQACAAAVLHWSDASAVLLDSGPHATAGDDDELAPW